MSLVRKSGSVWEGEVTEVDDAGNLITNFLVTDLKPLSQSAKVWFEFGSDKKPYTLRGFSESNNEKGKLAATPNAKGFVQFSIFEGNASQMTGLKVGSAIALHFRV